MSLFSYEALYIAAENAESEWSDVINLEQAYNLATMCREIDPVKLYALPDIKDIIDYADKHTDLSEWEMEVVADWPEQIQYELDEYPKQYGFRPDGDHWEVFSLQLNGNEEWKGTLETESLAIKIVNILSD